MIVSPLRSGACFPLPADSVRVRARTRASLGFRFGSGAIVTQSAAPPIKNKGRLALKANVSMGSAPLASAEIMEALQFLCFLSAISEMESLLWWGKKQRQYANYAMLRDAN